MSSVHLLDTNTINKIAAGEVVERPASCVKELVENSIDAGATRIEIEIQNGGRALMRVTDNGVGMNREDASLAVRRHATSKLNKVTDLQKISTLGFRGEALPTIAAVSKFTLQTRRPEDELGTQIKIDGGKIQDTYEIGCKVGTTVLVEELFFNTPVRLKFLKATTTEANKIHEFVVKLALSRPDIAFKFINGNRAVLTTPGNGNVIDALTAIYGIELSGALLPVNLEENEFKLTGFVSKPNFVKTYRNWQTFIVNGRLVGNRTVFKALDESYKSMIPKSGYPFALLNIEVPQNTIDVNVHPQKTELKFEDEGKIFKLVYRAVHEAIADKRLTEEGHDLREIAATPEKISGGNLSFGEFSSAGRNDEISSPEKNPFVIDPDAGRRSLSIEELREKLEESRKEVEEKISFATDEDFNDDFATSAENTFKDSDYATFEKPEPKKFEVSDKLEPLGQIDLCYIIARSGADLYIIDQHAAHERILFDRLSGAAGNIPAQSLLIPGTLKFDAGESAVIKNNLELFRQLGFTMELSGENEFTLTEIPGDASGSDYESMLREIVSSLPEGDFAEDVSEERREEIARNIRQSCLATTACRAAIKSGQELNFKQMQVLLDDLSKTPHPYTCPHGRPTIIKFSSDDLAKMFHRT